MSKGKSSKKRINIEARPRSYSNSYYSNSKNETSKKEKLFIKIGICVVIVVAVLFFNKMDSGLANAIVSKLDMAVSYQVQWNKIFKSDIINTFENTVASLLSGGEVPVVSDSSFTLTEPVQGHVVSEFEEKDHPVFNTKVEPRGIEYAIFKEQSVLASRDGVVTSVLESTYQGKRIVLKHENDYKTVYDGVETCNVKEDQSVKKGEALGSIDANEKVSKLFFFEVWKDNVAVDPLVLFSEKDNR